MYAVAYARYSSSRQHEESITAQLRAIEAYCAQNGMTLIDTYIDEAETATTDNRPAFQRMINDSKHKQFQAVVVHKIDRFARDRYDSAIYKKRLRDNGVTLYSVLERFDGSPESVILESVTEGMAEYYSRNLSREVGMKMREHARSGRHMGGIPPYGYRIVEQRYEINPVEAEAIRIIFTMYLDGCGFQRISDRLAENGYMAKNGLPLAKNSLHEILRNEKYTGTYIFARRKGKKNSHLNNAPADVIRVPGAIPQIISREQWDAVQAIMNSHHRVGRNRGNRVYLLSGLVRCGECGAAMLGQPQYSRMKADGTRTCNVYYICRNRTRKLCNAPRVPQYKLEEAVIDALQAEMTAGGIDAMVETVYVAWKNRIQSGGGLVGECRKQIAELTRQIDNLVNAVMDGLYMPTMKEKLASLEKTRAILQQRLATFETAAANDEMTREKIRARLQQYTNLKDASPENQRTRISAIVESITIKGDEVSIKFAYKDGRGDRI